MIDTLGAFCDPFLYMSRLPVCNCVASLSVAARPLLRLDGRPEAELLLVTAAGTLCRGSAPFQFNFVSGHASVLFCVFFASPSLGTEIAFLSTAIGFLTATLSSMCCAVVTLLTAFKTGGGLLLMTAWLGLANVFRFPSFPDGNLCRGLFVMLPAP